MFVHIFVWRTTTWLAITAVMMLFIAPWVSKSVMLHANCPHADSSVPATQRMMQDIASSMPEYSVISEPVTSPVEDIACGYCQLLISLPFILFALVFLFWLLLHFIIPLSAIAGFFSTLFRPWERQRARAPPAVFLP